MEYNTGGEESIPITSLNTSTKGRCVGAVQMSILSAGWPCVCEIFGGYYVTAAESISK